MVNLFSNLDRDEIDKYLAIFENVHKDIDFLN
jgi:hypothetical protein